MSPFRSRRDAEPPEPLAPGTITRLVAQQKHAQRVSVYLDGRYALGVHLDVVAAFGLRRGKRLDEALLAELQAADRRMKAQDRAVRYAAARARTAAEVRRKLAEAGYAPEDAEAAVERLGGMGLLDDAQFARDYAEARFRNKRYGPERIRAELLRKGVAPELAEAAVAAQMASGEADAFATALAEKRWAQLQREPDPRKRAHKLLGYLLRRGYPADVARRVTQRLARA